MGENGLARLPLERRTATSVPGGAGPSALDGLALGAGRSGVPEYCFHLSFFPFAITADHAKFRQICKGPTGCSTRYYMQEMHTRLLRRVMFQLSI
jgi:hypothetical protein